MFERILVLLDGSQLSELALPSAEELAGAFDSQVELVCVCEPAEREYRHMAQRYIERVAGQVSERIILHGVKDTGKSEPTRVKSVVLSGKPASEIVDYVERSDATLVILTSHGRSGLKPWSLGGTATTVVERVTKPVLLVSASSTGSKGSVFSSILVPLDGSDKSEAILPYIKELSRKLKSGVTLLRVVVSGYHVHTIGGLDYISLPEEQVERMKAEAGPYLAKVSSELKGARAVSAGVRRGDAAEEILKLADENGVSLIAMSTHGHSGIERWTFGSVTHKVLHSGKVSLLLVRAKG